MRIFVLLSALAMPLVAWLSQRGVFGPDNGTVSDRYPTLLVAAGYAFSIWGLIFALDVVHAVRQATGVRRNDRLLGRIAPATAAGFSLTALWMPLFSQQAFWPCVAVIVGVLACIAWSALQLSRDAASGRLWSWLALSLHAGWLSLAAFLNIAQAALAGDVITVDRQLGLSLLLFSAVAALLLALNWRMRGNLAYAAAALWGLVAVHVKQSASSVPGADVAAIVAMALAVALLVQTTWLLLRRRRTPHASINAN